MSDHENNNLQIKELNYLLNKSILERCEQIRYNNIVTLEHVSFTDTSKCNEKLNEEDINNYIMNYNQQIKKFNNINVDECKFIKNITFHSLEVLCYHIIINLTPINTNICNEKRDCIHIKNLIGIGYNILRDNYIKLFIGYDNIGEPIIFADEINKIEELYHKSACKINKKIKREHIKPNITGNPLDMTLSVIKETNKYLTKETIKHFYAQYDEAAGGIN